MLTLLFLGDIVGEPGRSAVIARLPELKCEWALDFIIVNGENAAAGRGITPKLAIDLLRAGASVITTGDHIWDRKEIVPFIETEPRLLRPLNYPPGAPGAGTIVLETAKGKVGVINVQARTFMQPILENPFPMLDTRGGCNAHGDAGHRGRCARGDNERENRPWALSRWSRLGRARHAHACANGR